MITQLRRRAQRPTVRHAQVEFAQGSTRLDTASNVRLSELARTVPLGVDPVTTVTAVSRSTIYPQPRLTAMLRAWKVSSYLRECGLGGTVITQSTTGLPENAQDQGSVLVTIEYLE